MTIVVAFLCTDGVVVAADSMVTAYVGKMPAVQHTGKKVSILNGQQVFAFAGSTGLADRFRSIANDTHAEIAGVARPLDYPVRLSQIMWDQFQSTGIKNTDAINLRTVLAYVHGDEPHCCIFEGRIQPRLLNKDRFYTSLGSGTVSVAPFLPFLVKVFCKNPLPNVREGVFLATWAIKHVIETAPGFVAGPIRVVTLEHDDQDAFVARELSDVEIEEYRQAIDSALMSLRGWRDGFQTKDVPPPPKLEKG